MKPGIYFGIDNDAYHASAGISKTGLWTIHSQSPAHYKFPPEKDEESTQAKATKDFGHAAHVAILEPNRFETAVMKGPADRRGNKWTDAAEFCKAENKVLLTEKDYDNVLAMRDSVHANSFINGIITGGKPVIEASGYWMDKATGQLTRCRPDLYRDDIGVMIDLKSTASAHPDAFARSVINYGYHAQEAHYSDGWAALGKKVDGFLFLAWEKKSPYAFAVYELPPSIVEEGRAIMRNAMQTYASCVATGYWPGYGDGIRELSFKRWAYQNIDAPEEIDQNAA